MTGARLRSTRSAWPCAGHDLDHSPRKGATRATMTGVDDRPLILSRRSEQGRQAERAGRSPEVTGIVTRKGRNGVTGSAASRARPGGVTQPIIVLELTYCESRQLQILLERHLKAIRSTVAFWKHETALTGHKPPFDLEVRSNQAQLIQRLYLELFDVNKANKHSETACKAAKHQE